MTIVDTVITELAQERASATNEFIRCVNKDLQSALAFLQASSLATSIPNLTLLGNISGVTAAPLPRTLTAFIDACIDNTQGDVLFRSAAGWVALSPGTSGQFLETQGAAANPRWAAVPAGSLANIAADTLLGNITGSAAPPAANSLSAVLDALLSNVQGDIIFRGASGWAALGPGTANAVLQTGGPAANPVWSSLATWTPVDASAGGLTFVQAAGGYQLLGKICTCYGFVTYPATSDPNGAQVDLPFQMANIPAAQNIPGSILPLNGIGIVAYVVTNSFRFAMQSSSSPVPITNAQLSGTTISFSFTYPVA